MKEFKIIGKYVAFPVGAILGLTEKQAGKRMHLLEKVDDGLYRVKIRPTGFKLGEIVKLDPEASKVKVDNMLKMKAMGIEPHGWKAARPKNAPQEPEKESPDLGPQDGETGENEAATDAQGGENGAASEDLDQMLGKMNKKKLREALKNRKVKFKADAKPQDLRAILKKAIEKEQAKAAK